MQIKKKQLRRMLDARYFDGFNLGYDEGKKVGDLEGHERGYTLGYDEGKQSLEGYVRGFNRGYDWAANEQAKASPTINYGLTAAELTERDEDNLHRDSGDECDCPKCKYQNGPNNTVN